jgi:hypothetical protein
MFKVIQKHHVVSNKMKTENTTAVGIILKSNIKIVEGGKLDTSTIKYMTDLFPGLVQTLQ